MGKRAVARIKDRRAASAYIEWADYTKRAHARRHSLLSKALTRMRYRLLVVGTAVWKKHAAEAVRQRQASLSRMMRRLLNGTLSAAFVAWHAFVRWKAHVLRTAMLQLSYVGRCFCAWHGYLRQLDDERLRKRVLDAMHVQGEEWLIGALGNILPLLLPTASAAHGQLLREVSSAPQLDDLQLGVPEELRRQVGPASGATAAAGEDEDASEARVQLVTTLSQLVGSEHSPAATRLLAFSRALAKLWDEPWAGAVERQEARAAELTREMGQLRTLSASRETQLLSEVAALRRFVVEQTKTYLSAMAEKTGKTAQLEAQCESLVATATNLGQKIESVGEALSGKCDAVTLTELSAQLDQLTATKAGKQELREMLRDAQRPAVTITRADGRLEAVVTDAELAERPPLVGSRPQSATAPHSRRQPEGVDAPPVHVVPGHEFDVVADDGRRYRGQDPPVITCAVTPVMPDLLGDFSVGAMPVVVRAASASPRGSRAGERPGGSWRAPDPGGIRPRTTLYTGRPPNSARAASHVMATPVMVASGCQVQQGVQPRGLRTTALQPQPPPSHDSRKFKAPISRVSLVPHGGAASPITAEGEAEGVEAFAGEEGRTSPTPMKSLERLPLTMPACDLRPFSQFGESNAGS